MFKKDKPYKRIRGTGRNIAGYNQLWMGEDHLLSLSIRVVAEEYKRFFYKDIQAFIIKPTYSGAIQITLCLLIAFLCAIGILAADFYWLLLILIPFLLYAAYVGFQRGTCKCWVKTATRCEELPSLNYKRRALKTIEKLRPIIEQAQGGAFTFDSLTNESAGYKPLGEGSVAAAGAGQSALAKTAQGPGRKETPEKQRRQFHKPLYALFIISAGMTGLEFLFSSLLMEFCGGLIFLAIGALVIMALVRQGGGAVSSGLRTLTWISGGFALIAFGAGYITFMAVIIQNPDIGNNHWLILKTMAEMSPKENSLLFALSIFHIIGCSFLGVTGLVLANKQGSHSEKTDENSQPSTAMPVAAGEDS